MSKGECLMVLTSVVVVSKSALCIGRSSPVKIVAPVGFYLPLTITAWMESISSLEAPCGFCWKANEHVDISAILSVQLINIGILFLSPRLSVSLLIFALMDVW